MKQLAVAVALLATLGVMAQRHEDRKAFKHKMDMTAEQVATLQTKKLTLALDLSENQQKKVMAIALEEAEHRKAHAAMKAQHKEEEHKRPTPEEQFERQNAFLDRQIAHDQKMKEVLTKAQYEKWKKIREQKAKHLKKKYCQ